VLPLLELAKCVCVCFAQRVPVAQYEPGTSCMTTLTHVLAWCGWRVGCVVCVCAGGDVHSSFRSWSGSLGLRRLHPHLPHPTHHRPQQTCPRWTSIDCLGCCVKPMRIVPVSCASRCWWSICSRKRSAWLGSACSGFGAEVASRVTHHTLRTRCCAT